MNASDYRAAARDALTGRWPMAVLTGLVAALLGGLQNKINFQFQGDSQEQLVNTLYQLSPEVASILLGAVGAIGVLAFVYAVVALVLGSVVQLGYVRFNLNLVDGRTAQLSDLFAYFNQLGGALVLRLLTGLFVALWSLLLVIPGIVAAYRYSAAPYIMAEDPGCGAMEALNRSKAMMDGHKMDLFLLDLSFIGWHLLNVFTLGLGSLLLTPYTNAARAAFFRSLQNGPATARQEPGYYMPYEQA